MQINVRLNSQSIKDAAKQLRTYEKSLYSKAQTLADRLGERGYTVVVERIAAANMPYATGNLLRSAGHSVEPYHATIYIESDYAIFVEFGTGIKGTEYSAIGYRSGAKGHGNAGWWYYKNGKMHHTRGQKPKFIMTDSANEIRELLEPIVKEVFGND